MPERLRARDVRERLKGRADPQVMYVLEALAEQQSVFRHQLMDLAQMVDQITNIVSNVVVVGENMKGALDQMKKVDPDDRD